MFLDAALIVLLFAAAVALLRFLDTLDHKPLYVIVAFIAATGCAWLLKGTLASSEGIVSLSIGSAALLLVLGRHQRAPQSSQDAPRTTNAPSMN